METPRDELTAEQQAWTESVVAAVQRRLEDSLRPATRQKRWQAFVAEMLQRRQHWEEAIGRPVPVEFNEDEGSVVFYVDRTELFTALARLSTSA